MLVPNCICFFFSFFPPHLIQSCLGHRVVLHTQPPLMPGELAEDIGQSSLCVWELILQRVVMLLFENAARKGLLDEVLDWLQCGRRATDPHNHSVAITKSKKKRGHYDTFSVRQKREEPQTSVLVPNNDLSSPVVMP